MSEFAGRVVLITGASGGLGGAVTRAFLEAGATVAGTYRSGPAPAAGERFQAIETDLLQPGEAARVTELVRARHGRLDVLLHLLGGFAGGKPVGETDDPTWKRMLDLNLNAAFGMARAVLPGMIAARAGRIVAVGSRTGVEPAANLSAYAVSKAGLVMLIRTIALECRNSGVTANCVLPSVIDTPANRAASPSADHSRWVQPESIARLLLWLASAEAADVSGAAIPIYGGVP